MTIASRISFTFTGEGECAASTHGIKSRIEGAATIGPAVERIIYVRIDVNATNGVNEVLDKVEVYTYVVIDVDTEKLFNSSFRKGDTTMGAGVGEFVIEAVFGCTS